MVLTQLPRPISSRGKRAGPQVGCVMDVGTVPPAECGSGWPEKEAVRRQRSGLGLQVHTSTLRLAIGVPASSCPSREAKLMLTHLPPPHLNTSSQRIKQIKLPISACLMVSQTPKGQGNFGFCRICKREVDFSLWTSSRVLSPTTQTSQQDHQRRMPWAPTLLLSCVTSELPLYLSGPLAPADTGHKKQPVFARG